METDPDSFPLPPPPFDGRSRTVSAGDAFDWLRQGWAVFAAEPAVWATQAVLLGVMLLAMSIVPVIGHLAANLLVPIFAAGMLVGCRTVSADEPLEIIDLFAGFRQNTGNLALLGISYMLAILAVWALAFLVGGAGSAGALLVGQPAGIGLAIGGLLLGILILLALSLPLAMAFWFAPALVVFHDMAPGAALKASFGACMKNLPVFLVFGLVVAVLAFFAALPMGLGFLVLLPVLTGSLYASYRDIFFVG